MKKTRVISPLVSALGLVFPLLVSAASYQLNVPTLAQEHSEWCWAASANAVLTYRRVASTQCGIVNWVNRINYACNQKNFYWNDGYIGNSANYMTGTTGISGILWSWGNRSSYDYYGPLSYNTARSVITSGNPVIVLWQWAGGGGHFVVVNGYDDNNASDGQGLYFMNPWPGEGAEYGNYKWMSAGTSNMGTHRWVESLVTY